MSQAFLPSPGDQIDQEVRHSLRVIRQQRAGKFALVIVLALLGITALLVTTYLGL